MDCPECARLVAEHRRMKQIYATAVELLFATGYHISDAAHKSLKNSVEDARVHAHMARLEIDRHRLFGHSKAS
jgi:hypothetical protein